MRYILLLKLMLQLSLASVTAMIWYLWANSLSVCIEVNVIDDRADISLELTNTQVSRRAALMPQSRT